MHTQAIAFVHHSRIDWNNHLIHLNDLALVQNVHTHTRSQTGMHCWQCYGHWFMVLERATHRGHFRFQFHELKFLLHFTGRFDSKWNVKRVWRNTRHIPFALMMTMMIAIMTAMISNFVADPMEFFELYWHSIVAPTVWLIISVLMQLRQSHSRNILTTIMNTWCAPAKTIIAIVAFESEKGSESRKEFIRQIVSKHFKSLSTNVTCVVTHADNSQCAWIPNPPIASSVISDLHFSLFSKKCLHCQRARKCSLERINFRLPTRNHAEKPDEKKTTTRTKKEVSNGMTPTITMCSIGERFMYKYVFFLQFIYI